MQPQALKQSKDLSQEEQKIEVDNDGDHIGQGWFLRPKTDFQWVRVDKVMDSQDTAINQVFEKNVELRECLVEARLAYTKLEDKITRFEISDAELKDENTRLKARVMRLEQEIQLSQPGVNSLMDKNVK